MRKGLCCQSGVVLVVLAVMVAVVVADRYKQQQQKQKQQQGKCTPTENDPDGDCIFGVSGTDYPSLATIPPHLSFTCPPSLPGIFADVETACQAYHMCLADVCLKFISLIGGTDCVELNVGQPTNAMIGRHPTSWPKKYSVGQDIRVNIWRMSSMEMVFGVVLLFLANTVLSSYLLEKCFVEEEPKFITFKNVMQLHLFRINSNISPSITISQGGWNQQIKYELPSSTEMFKWLELRVEFSLKGPRVLLNGSLLNSSWDNSRDHEMKKSKRWVVSVQDAHAYADCDKKWPLFELTNNNRWKWLQLPRSGNKEVVRLEPTENTTIKVRVEDTDKKLCQKGGEAQLQNNTNSTCHHLSNNTGFSNKITIADTLSEGNNQIRILVEDLKGTLYIVQCVEDCSTTPAGSGTSQLCRHTIISLNWHLTLMKLLPKPLLLERLY
ncbi:hypothetical protein Pcinc_022857 [Petrolisthes cinctipes]|uniref:Uncharacterized protein n=1 Tax=Petrolisthes cinctipes TaxID=88211 RepID=A0AAE1FDT6_PETCI|nr:hypothetical protein Pcinc_022857 [Petrolisthes cinctipes]